MFTFLLRESSRPHDMPVHTYKDPPRLSRYLLIFRWAETQAESGAIMEATPQGFLGTLMEMFDWD